ncbi:MAG TPA: hypothetical protein VG248_01540 [Caulobacteraceae bacterium]|nr:hypothetical protein [Caulobacteraceae bacterium]
MRGLYRHGVFLVLVGRVWSRAAAAFAFEWFADPYDLRFARPAARLADHPYRPYHDVRRLADYAAYQAILDRIAAGANVVTPAQWPG